MWDKNHYDLFGVSTDASAQEIKYAYARLIRQYTNEQHPEEFMHIRQAYTTLSNPNLRAQYDESIGVGYEEEEWYSEPQYETPQYEQESTPVYYEPEYEEQYEQEPYYEPYYEEDNEVYYDTPQAVASDEPEYSFIGNVIFSIILGMIFTPIVGLIAGVVIHVKRIPIWTYILGLVGCLIMIIVAVAIIGFIFG